RRWVHPRIRRRAHHRDGRHHLSPEVSMIRRILHAELSDVRAIAREAKRRAVKALEANVYLDVDRTGGCLILGPGPGVVGCGFEVNGEPDSWPDHARLLTIGRVTFAAW